MDIIGKLMLLLPETRGESARGPWARGGFVIETEEQFPRKVAFSVWGEDKLAALKTLPLGTTVKITFTIESREYNERWYTDCRCNDFATFASATPQQPYPQYSQPYAQQPMGQPQMPQQPYASQPTQMQQPAPQPQPTYQQPPMSNQPTNGTIENEIPAEDSDDLPF